MNLKHFQASSLGFNGTLLERGKMAYAAGLNVSETEWERAIGPVWEIRSSLGQTWGGFQVEYDRGYLRANQASWTANGHCSRCRAGLCEHLASLFLWIERERQEDLTRWQDHLEAHLRNYGSPYHLSRPPKPEDVFKAWIAKQNEDSAHEVLYESRVRAAGPHDSDLLFFLTPSRHSDGSLEIRPGSARPLKGKKNSDQMTKVTWHSPSDYRLRSSSQSDPVVKRVVEWWALARLFAPHHEADDEAPTQIDGEGFELLQILASHKRLFSVDEHDRPQGPLEISGPRKLCWSWTPDGERFWKVRPFVEGGGQVVLQGLPMYLDLASKIAGQLDLDGMSVKRARAMSNAPLIPKDWLETNAQSAAAIRCIPRPPPEVHKRSTKLLAGIKPIPVLTVAVSRKDDVFSLDLSFRYAETSCYYPPDADRIQFIKRGRGTTELVRDLEVEAAARNVLAAEGLILERDGGLRFRGDRSENVAGFRSLLTNDFRAFRRAGFEIATVEGWADDVLRPDAVDGGFARHEEDISSSALHFSLGFFIDGQRYNLLPLVPQLLDLVGGADGVQTLLDARKENGEDASGGELLWVNDEEIGRWIGLPKQAIVPWLRTLIELVSERKPRDLRVPSLQLSRIDALRLEADLPDVDLGGDAATIIRELLDAKSATEPVSIEGFRGELLPFQRAGFRWLTALSKHRLGGLLGDDRGLGKTVQCVAHLADIKHRGKLRAPALVVVPSTQVHHWRHHIMELAPEVKPLILIGADRAAQLAVMGEYDVVVTSWDSITRYVERLRSQFFQVAFLDETEKIHNPSTQLAKALRLLNIGYEVALNGSPLENNYNDVWAVVDAVLPGYFGTQAAFKRQFRDPIEQHGDVRRLKRLRMRLAPFMLRRLKDESGVDLPPVIHEDVPLKMGGSQANLYELIRISTEETVREALAAKGLSSEPMSVLPILTKLRQVCCDPSLTEVGREREVVGSTKLDWLLPKLDEMLAAGRRILLVGYFVEFFQLIEQALQEKGVPYSMIIGTLTPAKREVQKRRFKDGATRVFLLGLKSGGRGTDLPEADTVIHLDPWYNPKAHDQATDRAHRIGQVNTVVNLRLFIQGSIEERVIEIQDRKRLFADSLDSLEIFDEHKVTQEDIFEMLKPIDRLDEEDLAA